MKLRHAAAFALLSTLLVGCAVEGRPYEMTAVAPAKSAVYIYRPYGVVGSVVEPPVSCGDQSTSLGPGGYHRLVVDPGHLRCSVHTEGWVLKCRWGFVKQRFEHLSRQIKYFLNVVGYGWKRIKCIDTTRLRIERA